MYRYYLVALNKYINNDNYVFACPKTVNILFEFWE